MSSPTLRKLASPIAVAVVATLIARVFVGLSRADAYELDLYNGSIAWALLQGLPLDVPNLPIIPHARGSVVVGFLTTPFFALFGPHLIGLRIVAIALSCVTAALFAYVLQRAGGRAAGYAGALLCALLPPSYQMVDVLALGSHGDTVTLLFAALACLCGRGRAPLSAKRAAAFGLIAGFGAFFSLQFYVAIPVLLFCWLLRDPRFPLRIASAAALPAFVVGAAPSALFWSTTIVNRPMDERLLPEGAGGALAKLGHLLTYELRRSWLFEEHGGHLASWLYAGGVVVALLLLLPRLRRLEPVAAFLVLLPAGVLTAYAASDFQLNLTATLDGMGSRYMMPVLPCLAGAVALTVSVWRAPVGWVLVALVGGAGLLGWMDLLHPSVAFRQPPVRATNFPFFHDHIEHAAGPKPTDRLAWVERLDPDWPELRPYVYERTVGSAWGARRATELEVAIATARTMPDEVRPYLWTYLGVATASDGVEDPKALRGKLLRSASLLEGDELVWFLRGAGKYWFLGGVMPSISYCSVIELLNRRWVAKLICFWIIFPFQFSDKFSTFVPSSITK